MSDAFIKVSNAACDLLKKRKTGLTGSDYRVLWALLERMQSGGKVFCSQYIIAKEADVAQPMVSHTMKKFYALNLLFKKKGDQSFFYQFNEDFFQKEKS